MRSSVFDTTVMTIENTCPKVDLMPCVRWPPVRQVHGKDRVAGLSAQKHGGIRLRSECVATLARAALKILSTRSDRQFFHLIDELRSRRSSVCRVAFAYLLVRHEP